jgi:AraC-like DNA-binding protein
MHRTMQVKRKPAPALRPFIRTLWVLDTTGAEVGGRERVLPTGSMHLALRLSGPPFTLSSSQAVGLEMVGGARSASYVRTLAPGRSIGVQFEPGAAALLFGMPASELAERHVSLRDLWGDRSTELRERLASIDDPALLLDAMEGFLASRLPRVHGIDPAIAHALDRFGRSASVRQVVAEVGWSHRRFIERFREAVGLAPKRFCRVRRLANVLRLAQREPGASLADLALAAGYSDQPHFNREFRELAGMTPGAYRDAAPRDAHHVPIVNFVQD